MNRTSTASVIAANESYHKIWSFQSYYLGGQGNSGKNKQTDLLMFLHNHFSKCVLLMILSSLVQIKNKLDQ